jgi:hypothetical protein
MKAGKIQSEQSNNRWKELIHKICEQAYLLLESPSGLPHPGSKLGNQELLGITIWDAWKGILIMLLENLNWFFDGLGVALGGWLLVIIYRRFVLCRDSSNIYRWLQVNTEDEPHRSHKTMFEISNGTRIPEERVQKACLSNTKIMQSVNSPGSYSIWRTENQSVYDKRGVRSV